MMRLRQEFAAREIGFGVKLHDSNPEPLTSAAGPKAEVGRNVQHVRFGLDCVL
jgi:hypothetical protein